MCATHNKFPFLPLHAKRAPNLYVYTLRCMCVCVCECVSVHTSDRAQCSGVSLCYPPSFTWLARQCLAATHAPIKMFVAIRRNSGRRDLTKLLARQHTRAATIARITIIWCASGSACAVRRALFRTSGSLAHRILICFSVCAAAALRCDDGNTRARQTYVYRLAVRTRRWSEKAFAFLIHPFCA